MGLNEREACDLLGMSRGFLRNCERDGAPLYIALACAAAFVGLPPYKFPYHYRSAIEKAIESE